MPEYYLIAVLKHAQNWLLMIEITKQPPLEWTKRSNERGSFDWFIAKNSKPYQNGINKTLKISKSQCLSRFFDFNCHGAKSFILVWCEVVYPHRFSVLRPCSPSARHLPARYRGLEDGSLRFLLFLRSPFFFFYFLFFSSFSFVFLRFPSFSFRERYE